jgi:hypothetical protein
MTLTYHETDKPVDRHVYWQKTDEGIKPVIYDRRRRSYIPVTWTAQPGSQDAFLQSQVFETLYTGNRGPGKTDALLMDFVQYVGRGFGADWRGILFRRTYPELADVIAKSIKWFKQIFGDGAKFNASSHTWTFADGEQLMLRHFKQPSDYWHYHGHAYPWQGWEELCTWPDDKCYKSMFACARTTNELIPTRVRATCNPYGPGHNWVKSRWRLPVPKGEIIGPIIKDSLDLGGELEPHRVAINGYLKENQILLSADPGYIKRLRAAARNEAELAAWLEGRWDIVAGGMFDDVWNPRFHVLPKFDLSKIPRGYRINRSYDHGQSKPFSVGWWMESDGNPFEAGGNWYGRIKGDLIRIAEWYGWNKRPNEGLRLVSGEIAREIKQREADMGLTRRVKAGPADASIFDRFEANKSVAGDMQREGVRWEAVDKGPGSRKQGWEQMRKRLKQAIPESDGSRDRPGLFILETCDQFLRTVPVLPRDDRDLDDVDTDAEDHIGDEVRYRLREKRRIVGGSTWK